MTILTERTKEKDWVSFTQIIYHKLNALPEDKFLD